MFLRIFVLIAFMGLSLGAAAQVGHPAKGSWSGFYGPDAADTSRLRLLVKSWDGDLSAVLNPGRRGVDASKVELDAENWMLTIRADMPDGELVMVGKLSNLGSWTNRKFVGTYTMGSERGTFDMTLN